MMQGIFSTRTCMPSTALAARGGSMSELEGGEGMGLENRRGSLSYSPPSRPLRTASMSTCFPHKVSRAGAVAAWVAAEAKLITPTIFPVAAPRSAPRFDLAMRCGSTLQPPLHRKRLHQPRQRHCIRLPPIQDRLDDIRRQQREPQKARDIGRVDLLGRGKNGSEVRGSISTHDIPGAS